MRATTRQSILLVLGMVRMVFRYGDDLPGPEDGASKTLFRLPFDGQWVVLNGGVDEATSHSWDVWGQRYAYDFVVAESRDGDPDVPPALDGAVGCAGGDIRGNHVVIRHASGEHSTLAHLAPGSVAVRPGQEVRCGDVVGRCGNSDSSSEPHLHLHVQAGASFYAEPGVPMRFTGVEAEPLPGYGRLDQRPQPAGPACGVTAVPHARTRGAERLGRRTVNAFLLVMNLTG